MSGQTRISGTTHTERLRPGYSQTGVLAWCPISPARVGASGVVSVPPLSRCDPLQHTRGLPDLSGDPGTPCPSPGPVGVVFAYVPEHRPSEGPEVLSVPFTSGDLPPRVGLPRVDDPP